MLTSIVEETIVAQMEEEQVVTKGATTAESPAISLETVDLRRDQDQDLMSKLKLCL